MTLQTQSNWNAPKIGRCYDENVCSRNSATRNRTGRNLRLGVKSIPRHILRQQSKLTKPSYRQSDAKNMGVHMGMMIYMQASNTIMEVPESEYPLVWHSKYSNILMVSEGKHASGEPLPKNFFYVKTHEH